LAVALPLVALIFWIGLYPSPFLHRINGSVAALHDRLQSASSGPMTTSLQPPVESAPPSYGGEEETRR